MSGARGGYWKCSACTRMLPYEGWTPVLLDSGKLCCEECWPAVQQEMHNSCSAEQSTTQARSNQWKVAYEIYRASGLSGTPKDFDDNMVAKYSLDQLCEYYRRVYPKEWRDAYLLITGEHSP